MSPETAVRVAIEALASKVQKASADGSGYHKAIADERVAKQRMLETLTEVMRPAFDSLMVGGVVTLAQRKQERLGYIKTKVGELEFVTWERDAGWSSSRLSCDEVVEERWDIAEIFRNVDEQLDRQLGGLKVERAIEIAVVAKVLGALAAAWRSGGLAGR